MENDMSTRKPFPVTVYHSDYNGNAKNCLYPHSGTGSTPDELKKLFCYDHTFIRFKNNYRSKENFLEATVATLDNDNDHSDDPADWIPIEAIPELFPGVSCVISTSRNHMKQKGNRSPRPRYHVAFQMDTINTPAEYTAFNELKAPHMVFARSTPLGKSQHLGSTNTNALQNSEFHPFSG